MQILNYIFSPLSVDRDLWEMLIVPAQDEAGGRGGTSSMWAPGGAESKQQPGRGCLRAILEAKRKQLSPLWSGVSAELLPAVPGGAAAISRVLAACRAGCWAVPTSPAIPRGYGQGWAVVTRPVGGKKKIKKSRKCSPWAAGYWGASRSIRDISTT